MDSRSLYLGALLLALFLAVFSFGLAEARTLQNHVTQIEDSTSSDGERVRRDIQGLFDMISLFFTSKNDKPSPATQMITSVLKSISTPKDTSK